MHRRFAPAPCAVPGWVGRAREVPAHRGGRASAPRLAAFAKLNAHRLMDPGIMTIVFSDADRASVQSVLWQAGREDEPTAAPVDWVDYAPGDAEIYVPP